MSEPRSIVAISHAARMLAEAKTLSDVRDIRDLAEAARVYARAHDLGIEAEQHAADIKVLAEHRAGELIGRAQAAGEMRTADQGRPSEALQDETLPATLADLGIDRVQSHRWQTIAALPESDLRTYLDETKAAGRVPTSSGAYERAKGRLDGLMTSETPEWYTPPEVVAAVVAVLGSIDLDPCAEAARGIPAAQHFTAEDDGLDQQWRGRVYMNPPYGREIGQWVDKLCAEYEAGNVTEAVALVPGRIDTAWYRRIASVACHISGRLRFSGADPAPFPSVALYLGSRDEAFGEAFGPLGDVWRLVA